MCQKFNQTKNIRKTLYIDNSLYQQLQSKDLASDSPLSSIKEKLIFCANSYVKNDDQRRTFDAIQQNIVKSLIEATSPILEEQRVMRKELTTFSLILSEVLFYAKNCG
ncbi:MAG: hypothetical protein FD179_1181 [Erysipelotrichaceae bacterium]|nr:MAG: hypothetical protein FD179_1181 [Erysipelotrichaceae bacterium]